MSSPAESVKKSKIGLMAGVVVVLVAIGAGAFVMKKAQFTQTAEAKREMPLENLHLETFVVNLTDDDHTFLRIGIDLGVASVEGKTKAGEKPGAELASEVAVLRDTVLTVLAPKSSVELSAPDGRRRLKEELLKSLKQSVPRLNVREIYITEFLIQR